MASGYAGNASQAEAPRVMTLNERLNKVADSLTFQCERIESVLGRVNGTPGSVTKGKDVAQINPTHPLTAIVEMLESTNKRLAELANGVEQIA